MQDCIYIICAAEMLRKLLVDSRVLSSLSDLNLLVVSEAAVFHHLTNLVDDLEHLFESVPVAKGELRQHCNKGKPLPDYNEGLRVDV